MSEHFQGFQDSPSRVVSFLDFWLLIGEQLGNAKLKINAKAGNIHQLIDKSSDHTQQLREVIMQSYKRSRCYHLGAPIDLIAVLDILGETAYQLHGQELDDLLDIELLEEIAWCISERFASLIEPEIEAYYAPMQSLRADRSRQNQQHVAEVISLPRVKIKRANRQL